MNRLTLTIAVAVVASTYSASTNAKELSGTYTPEHVKASCDKVGGEYFPQGQTGTFGCENHDKGNMVLCNKEGKCTGLRRYPDAEGERSVGQNSAIEVTDDD